MANMLKAGWEALTSSEKKGIIRNYGMVLAANFAVGFVTGKAIKKICLTLASTALRN